MDLSAWISDVTSTSSPKTQPVAKPKRVSMIPRVESMVRSKLGTRQSQGGYTGSHQRRRSQQRQEILDTKSRNLPAFLEETLGKEEVAKQSLVDRQQKLLEFRKKKEDRASAAAAVAKKKPWGFAKTDATPKSRFNLGHPLETGGGVQQFRGSTLGRTQSGAQTSAGSVRPQVAGTQASAGLERPAAGAQASTTSALQPNKQPLGPSGRPGTGAKPSGRPQSAVNPAGVTTKSMAPKGGPQTKPLVAGKSTGVARATLLGARPKIPPKPKINDLPGQQIPKRAPASGGVFKVPEVPTSTKPRPKQPIYDPLTGVIDWFPLIPTSRSSMASSSLSGSARGLGAEVKKRPPAPAPSRGVKAPSTMGSKPITKATTLPATSKNSAAKTTTMKTTAMTSQASGLRKGVAQARVNSHRPSGVNRPPLAKTAATSKHQVKTNEEPKNLHPPEGLQRQSTFIKDEKSQGQLETPVQEDAELPHTTGSPALARQRTFVKDSVSEMSYPERMGPDFPLVCDLVNTTRKVEHPQDSNEESEDLDSTLEIARSLMVPSETTRAENGEDQARQDLEPKGSIEAGNSFDTPLKDEDDMLNDSHVQQIVALASPLPKSPHRAGSAPISPFVPGFLVTSPEEQIADEPSSALSRMPPGKAAMKGRLRALKPVPPHLKPARASVMPPSRTDPSDSDQSGGEELTISGAVQHCNGGGNAKKNSPHPSVASFEGQPTVGHVLPKINKPKGPQRTRPASTRKIKDENSENQRSPARFPAPEVECSPPPEAEALRIPPLGTPRGSGSDEGDATLVMGSGSKPPSEGRRSTSKKANRRFQLESSRNSGYPSSDEESTAYHTPSTSVVGRSFMGAGGGGTTPKNKLLTNGSLLTRSLKKKQQESTKTTGSAARKSNRNDPTSSGQVGQTSEDEYLSAEETTSKKGNENEGGLSESFRKGCSIGGAGRGVRRGVGTAPKQDERAPLTPLQDAATLKTRRAGKVATPSRLLTTNAASANASPATPFRRSKRLSIATPKSYKE